jgi:hypothetical protein
MLRGRWLLSAAALFALGLTPGCSSNPAVGGSDGGTTSADAGSAVAVDAGASPPGADGGGSVADAALVDAGNVEPATDGGIAPDAGTPVPGADAGPAVDAGIHPVTADAGPVDAGTTNRPDAGGVKGASMSGIVSGGGIATSPSYRMEYTLGQAGAGSSASPNYQQQSGIAGANGSTP